MRSATVSGAQGRSPGSEERRSPQGLRRLRGGAQQESCEYYTPDHLSLDEIMAITLAQEREATRMQFVHLGIPDDGVSAPTHRAGVGQSFDMLAQILG